MRTREQVENGGVSDGPAWAQLEVLLDIRELLVGQHTTRSTTPCPQCEAVKQVLRDVRPVDISDDVGYRSVARAVGFTE